MEDRIQRMKELVSSCGKQERLIIRKAGKS